MENPQANTPIHWYVLTTLSPQQTEIRLQEENAARIAHGDPRGAIQYFIPYQFLKRRYEKGHQPSHESDASETLSIPRSAEQVKANNQTRAVLRRYIFLRAHEQDLNELLGSDWNRWGDNRVQFFYDHEHSKVTVPDQMMEKFIDACCDMQLHFELVPSLEGLTTNEEVLLNATPFRGERARVLSVDYTPQGPRLTLGLQLFTGSLVLRLDNIGENDIVRHPDEGIKANSGHLIDGIQRRLLSILYRRTTGKQTEKPRANDRDTLDTIYNYRYHHFEHPSARRHHLVLMLICAHLRKDKQGEAELTAAAQAELEAINSGRIDKSFTDVRAYLHCALYLSTGDITHREAAKDYVRDHSPKSMALRSLVKLIRIKRV